MKRISMILGLLSVALLMSAQTVTLPQSPKNTTANEKPWTAYLGVGYTLASLGGLTGTIGGTYESHDLQIGYTLGMSSSKHLYWYDSQANPQHALSYKRNSLSVKYGYQFRVHEAVCLTPQLGASYEKLSGKQEMGTEKLGDGADAWCMSIGLKCFYTPVEHFSVFLAPEFRLALSQDAYYKDVMKKCDTSAGGLGLQAGLLFSF